MPPNWTTCSITGPTAISLGDRQGKVRHFLLPALWTLAVAVVSLSRMPTEASPGWLESIHADKFVHAFLYAVMYVLYLKAFQRSGTAGNVRGMSMLAAVLAGFVIEMLQWAIPTGRHFELLDLMANITGVLTGALFFKHR